MVRGATVTWVGGSGDWSTPANWSTGALPGTEDDVVIAAGPTITVTHSSGTHVVRSVQSQQAFTLSGGTLTVSSTLQFSTAFTLAGGTLQATTLVTTNGAGLVVTADSVLDGVALAADLLVPTAGDWDYAGRVVTVRHGLTLNGTLTLRRTGGNSGNVILRFDGEQTLAGSGRVVFEDPGSGYNDWRNILQPSGGLLTVGPGITIQGQRGTVGDGSQALVNQGTIRSDVGQWITVTGSSMTNLGRLEAASGGLAVVAGNWVNQGVLWAGGGTLNLGGTFATAQVGTVQSSNGVVNLTGTLNNTNATLALNEVTGSWNLAGGTILGGTVTGANGAGLVVMADSVLDGVALAADLLVPTAGDWDYAGRVVTVRHGLTLNGTLTLRRTGGNSGNVILRFDGEQTLAGSGRVVFEDPGSGYNDWRNILQPSGGLLTVGPGITIQGQRGTVGDGSQALVNQGTIRSDAGQWIMVTGSRVTNLGRLEAASSGGLAVVAGNWVNQGVLWAGGGTLNLGGTFATAQVGTVQSSNGVVNLTGTLNNTNATLALNEVTGSWNLAGGTILGGTVTGANGAGLVVMADSVLDGVALAADLLVPTAGDWDYAGRVVTVRHGLTLNGTLTLRRTGGNSGSVILRFDGEQTLAGSGRVVFEDPGSGYNDWRNILQPSGGLLTVGPGIRIRGQRGTVGDGSQALVNQGTIRSDVGQWITVTGSSVTNLGRLEAASGGGLAVVAGNWVNQGVFWAGGGTLNLGGTFATAQVGTVQSSNGVVNLTGTLNNTNATLALNEVTGSWNLAGGTILGGTVRGANGAGLVVMADSVLDGVALAADLLVPTGGDYDYAGRVVTVRHGLTLNGTLTLRRTGWYSGNVILRFDGEQTLAGSGRVVFEDPGSGYNDWRNILQPSGGLLTVGPGITIQGQRGTVGDGSQALVNQGTIRSDAGQWIMVTGSSVTNLGRLEAASSGGLAVVAGNWVNQGVFWAGGGTLNLGGTFATAQVGTVQSSNGVVNLTGTLNNTNATLALNEVTGSWNLAGGTILGGTVTGANGAGLVVTADSVLDGVALAADLLVPTGGDYDYAGRVVTVRHGLTLNGTLTLRRTGWYSGNVILRFDGEQTLAGSGRVVFEDPGSGYNDWRNILQPSGGLLTVGPGITIRGQRGTVGDGSQALVNQGTISADVSGATITITAQPLTNQGRIGSDVAGAVVQIAGQTFMNSGTLQANGGTVQTLSQYNSSEGNVAAYGGGTVDFNGTAYFDGLNHLASQLGGMVRLSGSLLGETHNALEYTPLGTLVFDGPGSLVSPQFLEVMSQDLGATAAGFNGAFVYGAITLANGTYLQLVDEADNATGSGLEALYVKSLIVPAGTTLDLDGIHLYTRSAQISGNVVNGTIQQTPDSGPITPGSATPGAISVAGEADEWTFFGRVGQYVSVTVDPGSSAVLAPWLNFVVVRLLDAGGSVLSCVTNTASGQPVLLASVGFPADGTYRVQIRAASGSATPAGNYLVTVWVVTPEVTPLVMNQLASGRLATPYSATTWNFVAQAGAQIRFDLVSVSGPGIVFDLQGPAGWWGFTNLTADSDPTTLPSAGSYSIVAHIAAGQYGGSYAFRLVQTAQTDLALGVPFSGQWLGSGQAQILRFSLPTNNPLRVVLSNTNSDNRNELYLKFGSPPTRADFDFRFTAPGSSQEIIVPNAYSGTWYALVYAETVGTPGRYEVRATTSGMLVGSLTPDHHGSDAEATLTLTGAGFDPTTLVSFIASNGTVYPSQGVSVDSFTQITVAVPSNSLPLGCYTVRLSQPDGDVTELTNAFTVESGGEPRLELRLTVPSSLGRHATATMFIEYANTGNAAMPAPLLVLKGSERPFLTLHNNLVTEGFWTSAQPPGFSDSVQFLASGGSPGTLQPGESRRVPIYYAGLQTPWSWNPTVQFCTGVLPGSGHLNFEPNYSSACGSILPPAPPVTRSSGKSAKSGEAGGYVSASPFALPVDWPSLKDQMRPATISSEAWEILWANFISQVGATWYDYTRMLSANLAYLGRFVRVNDASDISRLLTFEFLKADGLSPLRSLAGGVDAAIEAPGLPLAFSRTFPVSISGRFTLGPMGRGWSHNWQYSLEPESDGTIHVLGPAGSRRTFKPDRRFWALMVPAGAARMEKQTKSYTTPPQYFPQPGDHGGLTALSDGGFTLREPSGLLRAFRSDSKLDYLEDPNGNRITCGYSGSLLTSLTHSSGQSLAITYTGTFIQTITDSLGRQTLFGYSGEHLASVQYYDGRTAAYDYSLAGSSIHALTHVARSCCTHQHFEYEAHGWLSMVHRGGGAEAVTFGYDNIGKVTATDALGHASKFYFDHRGLLVKAENPLANAVQLAFDDDYNLVSLTDPAGRSYGYAYDANGNLVRSTDPLGNTTRFTFTNPFNRLESVTDAKGNPTRYAYTPKGNLQSITYANGSKESWAYDAVGNATTWTNRRSRPIRYAYDASGRITSKVYLDGSQAAYAYDQRGNLTHAATLNAPLSTNHFAWMAYDQNDHLTNITYPDGKWLAFTYDSAGRRASSLDQTGHRLTYDYDTAGRLQSMTNELGTNIVRYIYDAAGRLSLKTLGNGVYTTYEYDAAGQLLNLSNFLANGTVLSRFGYTYDSRGRRTAMDTLDGCWTYEYDDLGQLTHAVLASTAPDIPSQNLTYVYDALGNRIRTIENGVTTEYTANNLNQYVRVGSTSYVFDADGNLTQEITPQGTNAFTYSDENRLIRINQGGNMWEYVYDGFANRVATTENGVTRWFVIDPIRLGNLVAEYSNTAELLAHYDHGLGLLSQSVATKLQEWFTFDAVGSVREIALDDGAIGKVNSYDPFGASLFERGTSDSGFGAFGLWGIRSDADGLLHMRAREYGVSVGRFYAADPIGIVGDGANLYKYVGNQPTILVDPSGTIAPAVLLLLNPEFWVGLTFAVDAAGACFVPGYPGYTPAGEAASFFCTSAQLGKQLYDELGETCRGGVCGAVLTGSGTGSKSPITPAQQQSDFGPPQRNPFQPPADFPGWGNCGNFPRGFDLNPNYPNPPVFPGPGGTSTDVTISDPNQKTGPTGFGASGFLSSGNLMAYRVDFENDTNATAPSQQTVVTDRLSTNLDWTTLQWTEIGWGDELIVVPPNTQHFQTNVPASYLGTSFEVQVETGIYLSSGQAYVTFRSIDPATGLPPSVNIGFLPPEDGTGRGQGHLAYTIRPKPNLPTGTQIRNVALISFDNQPAIATNQKDPHDPAAGTDPAKECLNTFDALLPASHVLPLPAQCQQLQFTVAWTGQDEAGGSGVGSFDVYVSDNGGPWTLWQTGTPGTNATFRGEPMHTYGFYSTAHDNAGNVEPAHATADASIAVVARPLLELTVSPSTTNLNTGDTFNYTLTVKNSGTLNLTGVVLSNPLPAGLEVEWVQYGRGACDLEDAWLTWSLGTVNTNKSYSMTVTATVLGSETMTNIMFVSDNAGAASASAQQMIRVGTTSPQLSIALTNQHVMISWPDAAAGFTLESTTNLASQTTWTAVTNVPVVVGDQRNVSLPPVNASRFYRLKKP